MMTTAISSDTSRDQLAAALAGVDGGTLVSIEVQKKGVERGPKGSKKVYGNDRVHTLIWAGFDYGELVALADRYLLQMENTGTLVRTLLAEAERDGHTGITIATACAAVQEVRDSFRQVLNGSETESTNAHVFRPLVHDGEPIPGCKVYSGAGGSNPRSPIPGTVYIRGVKVGERVLEPAPEGAWQTQSRPKTIIKNLLRRKLPIGRFVQYILSPDTGFKMRIGKEASEAADGDGVKLRARAVHDIIQLAS